MAFDARRTRRWAAPLLIRVPQTFTHQEGASAQLRARRHLWPSFITPSNSRRDLLRVSTTLVFPYIEAF